jgi:hypothetical protein
VLHKVDKQHVVAVESLLEGGLFGDQDVDLDIVSLLLLLLERVISLILRFVFISTLLVDQAFSCEETADQLAFLHHVLRYRPHDS